MIASLSFGWKTLTAEKGERLHIRPGKTLFLLAVAYMAPLALMRHVLFRMPVLFMLVCMMLFFFAPAAVLFSCRGIGRTKNMRCFRSGSIMAWAHSRRVLLFLASVAAAMLGAVGMNPVDLCILCAGIPAAPFIYSLAVRWTTSQYASLLCCIWGMACTLSGVAVVCPPPDRGGVAGILRLSPVQQPQGSMCRARAATSSTMFRPGRQIFRPAKTIFCRGCCRAASCAMGSRRFFPLFLPQPHGCLLPVLSSSVGAGACLHPPLHTFHPCSPLREKERVPVLRCRHAAFPGRRICLRLPGRRSGQLRRPGKHGRDKEYRHRIRRRTGRISVPQGMLRRAPAPQERLRQPGSPPRAGTDMRSHEGRVDLFLDWYYILGGGICAHRQNAHGRRS